MSSGYCAIGIYRNFTEPESMPVSSIVEVYHMEFWPNFSSILYYGKRGSIYLWVLMLIDYISIFLL